MPSKIIILKRTDSGLDMVGLGVTSRDVDAKFARASQTQWSVDVFSASRTEDENSDGTPILKGAHYSQFRREDNTGTFSSVLEVVTYINENGRADVQTLRDSKGGYELTGAFSARTNSEGQSGANDLGNFVSYSQAMVDGDQWLRFGFNPAAQAANDFAYWTDPAPLDLDPAFDQSKGLFGGSHMPAGTENLFDFTFDESPGYSAALLGDPDLNYTAATGSFDFTSCQVGDLALVRFDFQVIPQTANTTIEVAMIWQTRKDGVPTFIFPLTGTPVFYGTGTVGKTFLNRPILSAYFASNEDVNARALLAVKADNPVQVAPLTTLCTIQR